MAKAVATMAQLWPRHHSCGSGPVSKTLSLSWRERWSVVAVRLTMSSTMS